jgi:hypothetical protein
MQPALPGRPASAGPPPATPTIPLQSRKGLRATAIIAQRRIQWRGDGVQLDIFLDAQHFLETEDEWAMAIVPVIQEFGATEMQKTNLIMISPFLSIWLITDLDASFST